MGEPQVVEGTDIKFWHIFYQNPERPDDEPAPLQGGASMFVLDSGQIISIPARPLGPNSKSFKEVVLEQYRSDNLILRFRLLFIGSVYTDKSLFYSTQSVLFFVVLLREIVKKVFMILRVPCKIFRRNDCAETEVDNFYCFMG